MKTLLLATILLFLSACVNKHGISAKYYSDCKEYYDMQGYYHKKCGDDDVVTYKGVKESVKESVDYIMEDENREDKKNVY